MFLYTCVCVCACACVRACVRAHYVYANFLFSFFFFRKRIPFCACMLVFWCVYRCAYVRPLSRRRMCVSILCVMMALFILPTSHDWYKMLQTNFFRTRVKSTRARTGLHVETLPVWASAHASLDTADWYVKLVSASHRDKYPNPPLAQHDW